MRHRRIVERADHVEQLVGGAQSGQLIGRDLGRPRAVGRQRRRRQVDVGHVGRDLALGLEQLGQLGQSLVGHLDHADVDGHAAEAAGLGLAAGERVEDGGLARPGKPDDRDLHRSGLSNPARGSTRLSSGSPRVKRPRLSQNSSMLRSSTRPLDHDVCGVTMMFGERVERRVGRQRLFAERVEDRAAKRPVASRRAPALARRPARRARR